MNKQEGWRLHQCFERAVLELRCNETIFRMRHDYDAQGEIRRVLKGMGLHRFRNLTHSSDEGRIAFALYAGDGIVVKIIPNDYLTKDVYAYHLPPISDTLICTDTRDYRIHTYPWVATQEISQKHVELLRGNIRDMGLTYTHGDDHPRNVACMPDRLGTLVGIDSNMYASSGPTPDNHAQILSAWREYVEELFPVYKDAAPAPQTENTSFMPSSLHNRDAKWAGFDHRIEGCLIESNHKQPKSKRGFWSSLGFG